MTEPAAPPTEAAARFADVGAPSPRLQKELGLVSPVPPQFMYAAGSAWVGTAAKLGPSHVVFWSLAILLFYLPQATSGATAQRGTGVVESGG